MRKIACFALILLLPACAGGSWTKEGKTPQAAAEDLADCNSLAQSVSERDSKIDTDIMASRGHDWKETRVTPIEQASDAQQQEDVHGDVVSRCMIAKGYAPGS
jgi:hypothetical protein